MNWKIEGEGDGGWRLERLFRISNVKHMICSSSYNVDQILTVEYSYVYSVSLALSTQDREKKTVHALVR